MAFADADIQADVDTNSASSDGKKRSKLGYHRTPVACGHCRRRKIRCIPSSEEPGAICRNCVRLKKDCHFLPVDQHGLAPTRKSRSGSKPESSNTETNATQTSPSPESSIDDQLSFIDSSGTIPDVSADWEHPNFPASPARHMTSTYGPGPSYWASPIVPAPNQYMQQNSYPGPVAGQYYMPLNLQPSLSYEQQQFHPISTPPPDQIESRYSSDGTFQDIQDPSRRQALSPIGNLNTFQDPALVQYPVSFSGPERSATLPASFAAQQSVAANTQYNSRFSPDMRQFPAPSYLPSQHVQYARDSWSDPSAQRQRGAGGASYPRNDNQRHYTGRSP